MEGSREWLLLSKLVHQCGTCYYMIGMWVYIHTKFKIWWDIGLDGSGGVKRKELKMSVTGKRCRPMFRKFEPKDNDTDLGKIHFKVQQALCKSVSLTFHSTDKMIEGGVA